MTVFILSNVPVKPPRCDPSASSSVYYRETEAPSPNPIRRGVGHASCQHDELSIGRPEHSLAQFDDLHVAQARDLLIRLSAIASGGAQGPYAAQPTGEAVPTGAVLVRQTFISVLISRK